MRVGVKICGVTRADAIAAAAEAGADAVGFVFAPSPRRLDPRDAAALAARVPRGVRRVAVFRDVVPALVTQLALDLELDEVQADARALLRFEGSLGRAVAVPVFRDVPTLESDLAAWERARGVPALALFEGRESGAGITADRGLAARLARRFPLSLAGGLDASNVADAIAAVCPAMVDVSSGVESSPGVKDPRLIRAFIAAVRAAEQTVGAELARPVNPDPCPGEPLP